MAKARSISPELRIAEIASGSFKLAGKPGPMAILVVLDKIGEMNVGELCAAFALPKGQISTRIAPLRRDGLLIVRKVYQKRIYSLAEKGRIIVDAARAISSLG